MSSQAERERGKGGVAIGLNLISGCNPRKRRVLLTPAFAFRL